MSFLLCLHATRNLITTSLCIPCRFPIQIQYAYRLNNFILCHDSILWTNNFIFFSDSIRYWLNNFILCHDSVRNGLNILFYIMIRCYGLIILFRFLIRYLMDWINLFYVMIRYYGLIILFYFLIRYFIDWIILFYFVIRYVTDYKILFYVMVCILLNNHPNNKISQWLICVDILLVKHFALFETAAIHQPYFCKTHSNTILPYTTTILKMHYSIIIYTYNILCIFITYACYAFPYISLSFSDLFPKVIAKIHIFQNSPQTLYFFGPCYLRIILVGNQLNAQFLLRYVYVNPLHVSSNYVLILRRTIVLIQHLV
jgi:hypothetical protein